MKFEGAVKLFLKVSYEILVRLKRGWGVKDMVISGSFRLLKNGSEEFNRESQTSIV